MAHRSPSPRLVLALALALLAAGCVGADDPDPAAASPSDEAAGGSAAPNASGEDARSAGLVATSNPEIPVLGLATYDGVPPERVEPFVPRDYTPVPCFRPDEIQGLDVYLVVTEEHHPDLVPGQEATVRSVSLLTCADRPEETRKDDANEPPWVLLMSWSEGQAVDGFLSSHGFSARPAEIAIETYEGGYRFQATDPNGTTVARGGFGFPRTEAPEALSCEAESFRGRVVQEGTDGLVSLGWNKTEAVCFGEAAIGWEPGSPLADVLGPAHDPSYAIDSRVEDARYWYRRLPGG